MQLIHSPMVPTGQYVLDIISFAQKCQIGKEGHLNNSDKAKLYWKSSVTLREIFVWQYLKFSWNVSDCSRKPCVSYMTSWIAIFPSRKTNSTGVLCGVSGKNMGKSPALILSWGFNFVGFTQSWNLICNSVSYSS